MTTTTCSCGNHEAHEIAHRRTLDGKRVVLWSDGLVTYAMGYRVGGVGTARSAYETRKNVEAGWLAFGEVEMYEGAEVGRLVQAARKAVRQNSHMPLDFLRATMRGVRYQAIKGGRVYRHSNVCACIGCLKSRIEAGQGADPWIHRPGRS